MCIYHPTLNIEKLKILIHFDFKLAAKPVTKQWGECS